MKKIVEQKMDKNYDGEDLDYTNIDQNVMNSIKEIRRKIKAEETRLKQAPAMRHQQHQNETSYSTNESNKQIEEQTPDQVVQEELENLLGNQTHRSHNSTPPYKQIASDKIKQHSTVGPILNRCQSANASRSNNFTLIKHFDQRKTPLRSSSQLENNETFFPSPPNMPVLNQQMSYATKQDIQPGKDYTADLFNNFEKATFLNDNKQDEIIKSNLNSLPQQQTAIIEASFTGNVKIHEVNKNGFYVRILNVSNTIDEDLSNFTIQQMVSGMPVAVFRFPKSVKLTPGNTITVWAKTDEVSQQPPQTFVWNEQDKWGTGPECTTILAKPNGQVFKLFKRS